MLNPIRHKRLVTLVIAALLITLARYAASYPGSVFNTAAPVLGQETARTADVAAGTYSVSTRTGAAQYSYAIVVPPGRHGMQPALALTYSSQNAVRGGVAAGWQLSIPSIRVDTSAGLLGNTQYLSALAGGQRLIAVDEPARIAGVDTFRAEQDGSYTRYEKVQIVPSAQFFWRALQPDGTTYFFGGDPSARDTRNDETGVTEARWFVTRIVDRFGNEVAFNYEKVLGTARNSSVKGVPIDIALSSIEYTANPAAGLPPHARIEFQYAPQLDLCPGSAVPIGAQFDYRTGIRLYEGARRLERITTQVRQAPGAPFRVRRIIELSFDDAELACNPASQSLHAPLRLLTAIRERGFSPEGEEAVRPPVTFTYGPLEHDFSETVSIPALAATAGDVGRGKQELNRAKAGGWPTIDAMLSDLDGDGRPDLLRSRQNAAPQRDVLCSFAWQRNIGGGSLTEPVVAALPTLPWANATLASPFGFRNPGDESIHSLEDCNLGYQFTRRTNRGRPGDPEEKICRGEPGNYVSYRLLDLDGDGDLDLVSALDYKRGRYSPSSDQVLRRPSLHGVIPACRSKPPCRDALGNAVACRTRHDVGLGSLALTTGDDTGGKCGFEECPNPNTNPNAPACDPGLNSCDCSRDYCGQPGLTALREVIGSEWDPPALDEGWSGARFVEGDVGHEDRGSSFGGNPWCSPMPEMACAVGEGDTPASQRDFMYIWRVHWNVGDGIFPRQPANSDSMTSPSLDVARLNGATRPNAEVFLRTADVHLSPVPLETDRAVSSTGNEPASSWTGFVDIDGDGFLDAVWQDPVAFAPHDGPTGWPGRQPTGRFLVFRGDGRGNFVGDAKGNPYEWRTPPLPERTRISLERAGYSNRRTNGELHRSTDTLVTLEDVNGDGLPDLIDSRELGDESSRLRVFYNTGAGFEPRPTILTNSFPTLARRMQVVLSKEPNEQMQHGWSVFERRPIDLDQDGLVDVAVIKPPADGQQNPWLIPGTPEPSERSGSTPSSPPSTGDAAAPVTPSGQSPPKRSTRLPAVGDLAQPDNFAMSEPPTVVAHFNVGDRLIDSGSTAKLRAWRPGLARIQLATTQGTLGTGTVWKVKTDLMDFDGDGQLDLFNNDQGDPRSYCNPTEAGAISGLCGQSANVLRDRLSRGHGLRLLTSVDNGRGAIVRFTYAPGTDERVVETETARGRRNPWPFRLVKAVEIDLEQGPSARTDYRYRFPVLNRDRRGRFGFRGFEETVTVHPANAQAARRTTIERYDYALDFSGLLVDGVTLGAGQTVVRIDSIRWQKMELFGGTVLAFHPSETQIRICDSSNNKSEALCRQSGALRREVFGWSPILRPVNPSTVPAADPVSTTAQHGSPGNVFEAGLDNQLVGRPDHQPERHALCGSGPDAPARSRAVMFVRCAERLTDRSSPVAPGDRGTLRLHHLLYNASTYHLLETEARRVVAVHGGATSWGKLDLRGLERTIHDSTGLGLPVETRVSLDNVTEAVTRREFDNSTGNVRVIRRPNQVVAGSSLASRFEYGPFSIYVKTTINEAGHSEFAEFDLATGHVIVAKGPHQPGVGLPLDRITYDGFGRPQERRRSVENASGALEEKVYLSTSYFDDEKPVRVRTKEAIEYDGDRVITMDRTYDGLGRLLTESVMTSRGAATKRYTYDPAGQLVSLAVPNPRGDDQQHALYWYEHDTVGRVTRWVPPTGAPITLVYNGLRTLRTEAPSDGSTRMPVRLTYDVFGRLRQVTEQGRQAPARMTYRYDANDNLNQVKDADGIVTTLEHDLANRRTAIKRGGRTWVYRYDLEGNRVADIAPHFENESEEAFTTLYTYDALNRLRTRHPARRNLSAQQLERFRVGDTLYEYDLPTHRNAAGRLARVVLPFGEVEYEYSVRGDVTRERRRYRIDPFGAGAISDERAIRTEYNALGQPVRQTHADGTVTFTEYDERGLPSASFAKFTSPPSTQPSRVLLAELTRNLNGVPTGRGTSSQRQEWTYDDLGRVTEHLIRFGDTVVGGETLVYDDVGNMKALGNRATNLTLQFTYHAQHQLIGAKGSTPDVYDADYTYSAAGRVLAARVRSLSTVPDVLPRDVLHEYEAAETSRHADPGAVRRLVPASGPKPPLATFDYDESGNLAYRTLGDSAWTFVYDGYDEMREAVLNVGTATKSREVYYYDHEGQRMLAAAEPNAGSQSQVRFWFDSSEIRHDNSGSTESLVHVALGAMPVAQISTAGVVSADLTYHGTLGHLLVVLGQEGSTKAAFGYGPYGEVLSKQGPGAVGYGRLFNGKEFDELTGLSYFGFRYYDRVSLSWSQMDPLYRFWPELANDQPRRAAPYAFANNNPLRYVDPDGLDSANDDGFVATLGGFVGGFAEGVAEAASHPWESTKAVVKGVIDTPEMIGEGAAMWTIMVSDESTKFQQRDVVADTDLGARVGAPDIARAYGNAQGQATLITGVIGAGLRILARKNSAVRANEGIYEFTSASGKTYVGQSATIGARIVQHLRAGKLLPAEVPSVRTTEVLGGKIAREVAEQLRINQLGGIKNLENIRNPIGPARQHLLPP